MRLTYSDNKLKLLIFILVMITLLKISHATETPYNSRYVVITHADTKNKTLSISELQGIYGLKIKAWDDKTPITIFSTNPLNQEHHNFCKRVLGVFAHQLQRAWDRLTYSGRAISPTIVSSFEEMRDAVAKTPGSIGYIPQNELTSIVYKVKIISGDDHEG